MNERVLVGHLRGTRENVCQVEQLCTEEPRCGGRDLKTNKQTNNYFLLCMHAVE